MFELMKIGNIFETPRGLVIGGTNAELDCVTAPVLRNILEKLKTVHLQNSLDIDQVDVLGVEISNSIGNNLNIHLLVSSLKLTDVKEGIMVYSDDIADNTPDRIRV
jgi:hypothetical protein